MPRRELRVRVTAGGPVHAVGRALMWGWRSLCGRFVPATEARATEQEVTCKACQRSLDTRCYP